MSDYIRVRHDSEYYTCANGTRVVARVVCPEFEQKFPGGETWDAYPMPVEYEYLPKSGDNSLVIPRPWLEYYWDINTPEGAKRGMRIGGGYVQWNINQNRKAEWGPNFNIPRDTDVLPIVDGITMGSWRWTENRKYQNIHKVLESKNGSTRVEAFIASDAPPDPVIINPQTAPHLFVLGTGVGRAGNSVLMNGVVTYWPLLVESKKGRVPAAWIDDNTLEFDVEIQKMGTYNLLTNQGMINFFSRAFGEGFFDNQMTRAGLTDLADNRQAVYEGPPVGEMALLYEEKVLLRDELIKAGYYEPPIPVPMGTFDPAPILASANAIISEAEAIILNLS